MSSKLILYFTPGSPPSRACLLLARYLKLDIEVKNVNLMTGENRSEEFLKLNPLHKVPVLVDGDFVLTESRAILAYLVNSRKPGSDLYPSDPKARALVDRRLYYDAGVVFDKLAGLVGLVLFRKIKVIPQENKDAVREMFKVLNDFLAESDYLAGKNLTIADFSAVTTITTLSKFGYDLSQFEHLNKWFNKLQSLPGFDENVAGATLLAGIMKSSAEGTLF